MKRIIPTLLLLSCAWVHARAPSVYSEKPPLGFHSLTDFQDNSSIIAGTGTSTSNTNEVYIGTQSNRLTGGSSIVYFGQTISPAANVCADSFITITLQFKNTLSIANLSAMEVIIATNVSNSLTSGFGGAVRDTLYTRFGTWMTYTIPKRKFTQAGTFNCASVNSVAISLTAQAAVQCTVSVAQVGAYKSRLSKGIVIFTIDDQYRSWDSLGQPEMESRRFRSTHFVNPGLFGQPNKLTLTEFKRAYARGYISPSNHLWTHDSVPGISNDSFLTILRKGRDFIRSEGLGRAYNITAMPLGIITREKDSVMRASRLANVCRMVGIAPLGQGDGMVYNPYYVPLLGPMASGTTEATMETRINDLIASKTVGIILGHQLCGACATNSTTWLTSDLIALLTFLKTKVDAGLVEVLSWDEYLKRRDGGFGPARRIVGY